MHLNILPIRPLPSVVRRLRSAVHGPPPTALRLPLSPLYFHPPRGPLPRGHLPIGDLWSWVGPSSFTRVPLSRRVPVHLFTCLSVYVPTQLLVPLAPLAPLAPLVHWLLVPCLSPACLPISPKAQYYRDIDKHGCKFFPVLLIPIPKSPLLPTH